MQKSVKAQIRRAIRELVSGETVDDQIYRVQAKDLRTTSNGGLYIHAVLADATGQMLGRMWNASQQLFDSLPAGGLARFRGRVETYRGNLQFIIDGVRICEAGEADPADFLPCTPHDIDEMWGRLVALLRTVRNPDLLALIAVFMRDEAWTKGFRRAPAAHKLHHAYIGGLLEHTLSLMELAERVLPHYPQVSRDLVLTGLFLHDCGKIVEYTYDTTIEYTAEGQLVGHIVNAVIWIEQRAAELAAANGKPLPADLLLALKHIIVGHHGRYEFGSPRLPATAEAFMVHYLDNLDAKLNQVFTTIAGDADDTNQFTPYVPALEARLWKADPDGARQRPGG